MWFRSTNSYKNTTQEHLVSFKDAVLGCLPADGGLYVPDKVMDIRQFFLYMDEQTTFPELVAAVAPSFLEDELNPISASIVAESAFSFAPELIQLDENFSILNLYNGPTGSYKDFGIAFLSALLEELRKDAGYSLVLAAVRGTTGASIAHAFSRRKGIGAVLIYPSGPIRGLDPAAFVPNGGNIIPIQVKGTFDDCQRLVNETISDRKFSARYSITSANAINPGRLLPQTFYYLYAFVKIKKRLPGALVFSTPCGNFGNLMAGLYAWKFGMPVNGFIAAMNSNNSLGDFIKGGSFTPGQLVSTNSPALDVRIPSNLSRLDSFYREAPAVMRNMVYPASIDDDLTLETIAHVRSKYGVYIDPHTAVAFAAAQRHEEGTDWKGNVHTIVLSTGHYSKADTLIRKATGENVAIPEDILSLKKMTDPIAIIPPNLYSFENVIASCF
jgi:threonine synthase